MSTKPMEFTLDGVVSTKKPNDCPDCKIRVETYLKSIAEWKSALEAERAKNVKLREALTKGANSPRELCALMSEGEGPDVEVYRTMANSAMRQIDNALKESGDE